ncbi:hypothetical protein ACFL0Q_04535 [Thermodesulfobacteriota bacterium]
MPSISCFEQTAPHQWDYSFVLVDPDRIYGTERHAVTTAEKDLAAAFLHKQRSGPDYSVGEYLCDKGYVSMTDFKIVQE